MIELREVNKENVPNNIIKEEKKENKVTAPQKNGKQKKGKKKKKEIIKHKINIYLAVNDINNMISMQEEQNKPKFLFFCIIILFTLQIINTNFIFFLGYLRPTFITNKYYCYNSLTKHYKKCLTNSFCYCKHDYCTTFCYESDFSKCPDVFESQAKELHTNKLITLPSYERNKKLELEIIYPLEEKEKISVFQKIGYYYCFIDKYSNGFIIVFTLGCCLGYYIFGIISDLYGRKICIIFLSLLTFVATGGISVISHYALYEHIKLLTALWVIFIFLLGMSLEPLESAVYIYFLEMFPSKVLIKPINSLLFIRYFLSLGLLCFFDIKMKNLIYIFYAFETYLVPFNVILIFMFRDTPRFFSERQDMKNKMLSFFIKDNKSFTFKENDNNKNGVNKIKKKEDKFNDIQKTSTKKFINYSYLYKRFKANKTINKNYYIILFANIILNYLFYTILLKFIFFFLNPYNNLSLSTYLIVFILLIIFYTLLQVLFYILFEIFSLSIIISVLLFLLFLFGIFFDAKEFNLGSYRKKIFYPDLSKNNENILSLSLFLIVYIIGIYEMMLIFLSPTLYRTYFFFCQKGVSSFSLIFAFISVYNLDYPILFVSIFSFFSSLLFLSLRVKWEKIALKEEINKKLKTL